jgi:hypothetical protein
MPDIFLVYLNGLGVEVVDLIAGVLWGGFVIRLCSRRVAARSAPWCRRPPVEPA